LQGRSSSRESERRERGKEREERRQERVECAKIVVENRAVILNREWAGIARREEKRRVK